MANLFAQAEALAFGKTLDSVAEPHRSTFAGNRPTTTILAAAPDARACSAS